MRYIWRLLSSVRLALWVILLLAAISLAGALIIQYPPGVAADHSLVPDWIEQIAQPKYGGWTPLFRFLGFFDVFHSPLFLVLGSVLVINIAFCSLKRWPSLAAGSKGVELEKASRLLNKDSSSSVHGTARKSVNESVETALVFFRSRNYRIRQTPAGDGSIIAADKNRFTPWGTYAIHLSLILLIAGYVIGGYSGYENNSFIVVEGQTRAVGDGYDISLYLDSFEDEYWPDGSPKDYRSQVEVIENDQVVEEGLVRVNYPLEYNGLKVYQSFYGPAVNLYVEDATGSLVSNQSLPLSTVAQGPGGVLWPYNEISFPAYGIYGFVIGSGGPNDETIPVGELHLELYDSSTGDFLDTLAFPVGTPVESNGLVFTAESLVQYSGFQLREDPGLPLIWISFTLFMLGLAVVFYFPHRQILVSLQSDNKGTRYVYAALGKKSLASDELRSFGEVIDPAGKNKSPDERKSLK